MLASGSKDHGEFRRMLVDRFNSIGSYKDSEHIELTCMAGCNFWGHRVDPVGLVLA